MINMLTLFPKSIETEIVEDILSQIVPALKQAHGLRALKTSTGDLMSPAGPPVYSQVVEASFETLEDFMGWAQSPSAQARKPFMLENGILMLFYEVNEM